MILLLVSYFIFFYWQVITHPYSVASAESLDCDFPSFVLCGREWSKLKVPYDEYYFGKITGARTGTFYPVNIVLSVIASKLHMDKAWIIYLANVLGHSLVTAIAAYYLFGQGLIGLFGALVWGFMAYHVKFTLWYTQTFAWISLTILALVNKSILTGLCLGMLILCGHPPLLFYTLYFVGAYSLVQPKTLQALPIGLTIGLPQILSFYIYRKGSVRHKFTLDDNVRDGSLPLWSYLFMFIPVRIRDFVGNVGYEEWCFYITPIVGLLAFYSHNLWLWIVVLLCVGLSLGKGLFKLFSKLMFRFPHRWGYFASFAFISLSVDGLRNLNLNETNLWLLIITTGWLLLYNRDTILLYPFKQDSGRPSKFFDTPLMRYLERHAKVVNNLPYPVYSGQLNKVHTLGYTGGNHNAELGKLLGIPHNGEAPYNIFDHYPDGFIVGKLNISHHIGTKPSNRWLKVKGFKNLWSIT